MPSRQEIVQFLSEFKAAIRLGHVRWLTRPVERQHLIDLNLTQNQALECLENLTPDNYCKGPEPDDVAPNRSVWMFGVDVDGVEAYIKLALQPDAKRKTVNLGLIWSFHRAEFPLKFPLRSKSS